MSNDQAYERYKLDNFHSKALEKNPLNSTADRIINIYLPPDYFKSEDKRYPVIYFLHGYGGHNRSWTITSKDSKDSGVPWDLIPKKILKRIDLDRLITFESLDKLILNGDLEPFILVQPEASLQIPHKRGIKDFRGLPLIKGSFYINSPYTGNYIEYIIDIINYIDKNYRTIADKQHRGLMGGSMGGYGTLYLCLHHPEKFISAVSLSPGNIANLEFVNWKLRVPIYKEIFGIKMCEQLGDMSMEDILDSYDLIASKDNPLLPSIKRDESGNIIKYNTEALRNWQKYDLNNIIRENPKALKQVHLLLNCERTDEFGLADGTMKIHETLLEFGIDHQFELYSDPTVVLTPHILGIGYKILPGIRFCLEYFV
jgi:pimeloyl-ACP methyl ester carboxylesterase